MADGIVALPVQNGVHSAPPLPSDLPEFEKLIRLRDEIFANRHPRLKLKNQQQHQQHQQQSAVGVAAANAAVVGANRAVPPPPNFSISSVNPSLASGKPQLHQGPITSLDGGALPGLNPALLSGPPLLTSADRNLSRSVIQAHLKNEILRKPSIWPKLDRENILPDYDVDDLLKRAHKVVRPFSFDKNQKAKERGSPRSGEDNNSYYSSQGNDEEEEEAPSMPTTKPCPYYFKGKCHRGDNCKFSHDPAFEAQLKPKVPLTQTDKRHGNAAVVDGPPSKRSKRDEGLATNRMVHLDQGPVIRRVDEFGRDIPPGRVEADEPYGRTPPTGPRSERHDMPDRRHSGRVAPPTRDGPIVRNQVMSPIAPQPARVSPLAVSKGAPRVEQIRLDDSRSSSTQGAQRQGHNSPGQIVSRKRRRDQQESGEVVLRRRIDSPPIQIKEEPTSPRVSVPQHRYVSRGDDSRQQQAVIVESHAPGVRRIEYDGSREVHYVDEPGDRRVSSPMVRVVSRAEGRYEVRREPELRRVVSERHPMRAASPAMYASRPAYDDEHLMRPAGQSSVVYMRENEAAPSYRASVAPPASQHGHRSGLESTRPEFVEPRRVQSPGFQQSMPPPSSIRRIVRDQYGNEFYEQAPAPPDPRRYSVAPEPRYAPEHAYARPVSRMTSVMPEPTRQMREGTMMQRRDDEPTSPRFVEGGAGRAPSAAPYARREPPSEYAGERQGQQIVRMDDGGRGGEPPYERVIYREAPPPPPPPGAMYSERGREAYYEQPPREVYRVQSVRPEAVRYGSMAPAGPSQRYEYVDERSRQYMPGRDDRPYVME